MMRYHTVKWQGSDRGALLLQQILVKQGNHSLLLAACSASADTETRTAFQKMAAQFQINLPGRVENACCDEKLLYQIMKGMPSEASGILLVDDEGVLVFGENSQIYLLQKNFGNYSCNLLEGEQGLAENCRLEAGCGLLICTEGWLEAKEEAAECLGHMMKQESEAALERALRELGDGKENGAAVFVHALR